MNRLFTRRNAIWKRYIQLDEERDGDYTKKELNYQINGVINELLQTYGKAQISTS